MQNNTKKRYKWGGERRKHQAKPFIPGRQTVKIVDSTRF